MFLSGIPKGNGSLQVFRKKPDPPQGKRVTLLLYKWCIIDDTYLNMIPKETHVAEAIFPRRCRFEMLTMHLTVRLFGWKKMNRRCLALIIPLLLAFLVIFQNLGVAGEPAEKSLRASILAGTWYPADTDTLRHAIEGYLERAGKASIEGDLMGLLVPHAGHRYSGRVAASAYNLLKDKKIKKVIMIGPSHRVPFRGVSVNVQSAYQTPLGTVPVDQFLARRLIEINPEIRWLPHAHAREHSLEIQLPFLQTVIEDFQIVPLVMGQQDFETCLRLAHSLISSLESKEGILFLASTDLSHFHPAREAERLDRRFIEHISAYDTKGLSRSLNSGGCEACGGGPAMTVMLAVQELGADRSVVLDYAHSGHVTGDLGQVVGYLSAAFVKTK